MLLTYIVLGIALIGTISSTVFFVLTLLGAAHFRRSAARARETYANLKDLPPVSVLKPVHGVEAQFKENIESFFRQDYPAYEILFAADEEDDTALPVIREVAARYPHVPCKILITGQPLWPNAPNYCFHRLSEIATYDIFVTSDSDVEVAPDYLREVVPPLLDPKVGAVTCMFRGKTSGGIWSKLDAIGMSVEFSAGVLVANLFEGIKFGLGPTIVVRRDSLASIGGYAALRPYLSNDFVTGNFIEKAGYKVVLSQHIVDHIAPPMTFHRMWERQLRWAMGTRYSRPKGHVGTGLIFAVPYGILGFVAGLAAGFPLLGSVLLLLSLANRMIECWIVGWDISRDPAARRAWWWYPARDLLGFIVWCASYVSQNSLWRDNEYKLLPGGRLVARRANGSVVTPS